MPYALNKLRPCVQYEWRHMRRANSGGNPTLLVTYITRASGHWRAESRTDSLADSSLLLFTILNDVTPASSRVVTATDQVRLHPTCTCSGTCPSSFVACLMNHVAYGYIRFTKKIFDWYLKKCIGSPLNRCKCVRVAENIIENLIYPKTRFPSG